MFFSFLFCVFFCLAIYMFDNAAFALFLKYDPFFSKLWYSIGSRNIGEFSWFDWKFRNVEQNAWKGWCERCVSGITESYLVHSFRLSILPLSLRLLGWWGSLQWKEMNSTSTVLSQNSLQCRYCSFVSIMHFTEFTQKAWSTSKEYTAYSNWNFWWWWWYHLRAFLLNPHASFLSEPSHIMGKQSSIAWKQNDGGKSIIYSTYDKTWKGKHSKSSSLGTVNSTKQLSFKKSIQSSW